MKKHSDPDKNKASLREKIIGLGERSVRKSYYPQLQNQLEKLEESEKKYRDLAELLPEVVFEIDEKGNLLFVNNHAFNAFGYTQDDFDNGLNVFQMFIPGDRERAGKDILRVLNGEYIGSIEYTVLRKDGITFPVVVFPSPIIRENKPIGLRGILIDITERKRVENIMQARLRLLEFANSHSMDEFLTATLDEIEALTGSAIGFYHFLESDQKTLLLQNWSTNTLKNMCTASGKGRHYDIAQAGVWVDCVYERRPIIHNDYASLPHRKGMPEGHAPVIREVIVPIFRGDLIKAIIGVGNKSTDYNECDIEMVSQLGDLSWDIAERKRAEEELRKLSRAVEQSPASVIITDLHGNIEYLNPKFTEVTGYSLEDVRGKNPRILKSGETPPEEYQKLWKTITSGGEWHGVFHNKRKDGTLFWERASISAVRDSSGAITHFIAVKEDITNQKSLEDQLLQAQKMEAVGQLAGGIAHDFNNILTAMIGYGHLLKMKLKEDDPLRTYTDQILSLSDRAANLTQSLLSFSRKRIMNPEPVNLNEIIKRIDHLLSRIIGEDIKLQTMLSEEDLIVMADSGHIEQVLMNLATNARDAMPEGGFLTIGTEKIAIDEEFIKEHGFGKEGEYALIAVTDTGAGMDRETSEKIFEPFFTTKEVGKGTGLGLAMVYGIIKQHEGYINVYSEPGSGTTFRIYLALIKAKVEEIKPEAIQTIETGTETVLLAEDETEVREFTKKLLEEYGYKVITAASVQEAIDEFKAHEDKIQLLLFDVIMPNRNGKEAYDEIKKIRPDIKVLFMSGYPADIINKHGILENGFAYIEKPVSPTKLLKKIREVLGKSLPPPGGGGL